MPSVAASAKTGTIWYDCIINHDISKKQRSASKEKDKIMARSISILIQENF